MASNSKPKINTSSGGYCSFYGCSNSKRKRKDLHFFRFPRDDRCKLWVREAKRQDLLDKSPAYLNRNCRVCSLHFHEDQFMNAASKDKLCWNAIPSWNLKTKRRQPPTITKVPMPVTPKTESSDVLNPVIEHNYIINQQTSEKSLQQTEIVECLTNTVSDHNYVINQQTSEKAPQQTEIVECLKNKIVELQNELRKSAAMSPKTTQSASGVRNTVIDHNYVLNQQISEKAPQQKQIIECLTNKIVELQNKLRKSASVAQSAKSPKTHLSIDEIIHSAQQYGMKPESVSFLRSQLENCGRKDKGHRWSTNDKAIARGVYFKSPQAYETLSSLFSMPSASTLQRFGRAGDKVKEN